MSLSEVAPGGNEPSSFLAESAEWSTGAASNSCPSVRPTVRSSCLSEEGSWDDLCLVLSRRIRGVNGAHELTLARPPVLP